MQHAGRPSYIFGKASAGDWYVPIARDGHHAAYYRDLASALLVPRMHCGNASLEMQPCIREKPRPEARLEDDGWTGLPVEAGPLC